MSKRKVNISNTGAETFLYVRPASKTGSFGPTLTCQAHNELKLQLISIDTLAKKKIYSFVAKKNVKPFFEVDRETGYLKVFEAIPSCLIKFSSVIKVEVSLTSFKAFN